MEGCLESTITATFSPVRASFASAAETAEISATASRGSSSSTKRVSFCEDEEAIVKPGRYRSTNTNRDFASSQSLTHTSYFSGMNEYGKMSTRTSPVESVMERLENYEARGWLSRNDFVRYRRILKQNPSVHREVERELKALADSQRFDPNDDSRYATHVPSNLQPKPSILLRHQNSVAPSQQQPLRNDKRHVSWEDQSYTGTMAGDDNITDQGRTNEDKENAHGISSSPLILEPADLWQGSVQLSEQELQNIFVEMCFFARLGFVQPPCCLHCTYQDTMEAENNDSVQKKRSDRARTCPKWVVWRKNAKTLLHPNRLDGNIFIVRCHVARRLLEGDVVEGRKWDAEQKKVLQME